MDPFRAMAQGLVNKMEKELQDLEEIRSSNEDGSVRSFRHHGKQGVHGAEADAEELAGTVAEPGHSHGKGHVPAHTHPGLGGKDHAHGCGCGHNHGEEDLVGHHHEHPPVEVPHHNASYTHTVVVSHHKPGHGADCHCEQCCRNEEYCDICGESLAHCKCRMPDADDFKCVYILENLDCANCAARMEHKIKRLPGVTYATVSYPAKQLRLSAKNPDKLLPILQEICMSVDSEVRVIPKSRVKKNHGVVKEGPAAFRTYAVKGLDCAVCAQKVEDAINDMPEIDEAVLTYATGLLRVKAESYEGLQEKMQSAADAVEKGVTIATRQAASPAAKNEKGSAHGHGLSGDKREWAEILAGGLLFVAVEWLGLAPEAYKPYLLVLSYIVLGWHIVLTALRNGLKGEFFDENFLMTVATLGAFAIQAWEEAVGVILFYRIGEYFQDKAAERSRRQIMAAVDLRPEEVRLLIGDEVRVIPAAEAGAGDILLVRAGDRIPLDGVVVEGESLVDTSPVTGEPVPVRKRYGDEVLSGCVNTTGMLKFRVEKELQESMVTKILDSVENAAANKPHIDKFITRFARVYTPIVVVAAMAVAVIPSLVTGNWQYWIYTALTFLVISCPCALVLSVPLSFFAGIGAGSRLGILFKGGSSLEMLKNVAAVVMDKTGTVTQGNFVLHEIVPAEGVSAEELLQTAAGAETVSTHPIAVSIVHAAEAKGLPAERPDCFEETAGEGLTVHYGKDRILAGNLKLMRRYGVEAHPLAGSAVGSEVYVAKNGRFLGAMVIRDTVKPDARDSIEALRSEGLVTVMLTGDAPKEAEAVAREVGIQEVRAGLLPQDKLNEMNMLRSKYGAVLFVGDGINDAPVLAGADVGAAMGSGADAAMEAADVVFMNSEMGAIPKAIKIAKTVGSTAWQNVVFALVVKIVIMAAGIFGYANMWAAVFADTGVSVICVLNACRILYKKF